MQTLKEEFIKSLTAAEGSIFNFARGLRTRLAAVSNWLAEESGGCKANFLQSLLPKMKQLHSVTRCWCRWWRREAEGGEGRWREVEFS